MPIQIPILLHLHLSFQYIVKFRYSYYFHYMSKFDLIIIVLENINAPKYSSHLYNNTFIRLKKRI